MGATHLVERFTVTDDNARAELLHRDFVLQFAAQVLDRRLGQQHHRSHVCVGHLLQRSQISCVQQGLKRFTNIPNTLQHTGKAPFH